jgi:endoglucanase
MKLALLLASAACAVAAPPTTAIKVDQVGYLPSAAKLAMVVSTAATGDFTVRGSADGAVAFHGSLSTPARDEDSGDDVRIADFTRLQRPGSYYVDVAGVGRSFGFAIGADVYRRTWYLAMRSYYGQRCGVAVDLGREFPGYKYDACHLQGAYHPSSGREGAVKSAGGWHDAGDYGRYVVNSGVSTGTLLWAWEFFGARVKGVRLDIPESGNGVPDLLNEVRWNLNWMLSMQDADGGAWHKQTTERFGGFILPHKETAPSVIIGTGSAPYKSTCATADLAAVAAIAARVYKPFDAAFAARSLDAARRGFAWAEKNPAVLFRNPEGVSTGAYGDRSCADEILWASAELFRTSGEAAYQRYFLEHYAAFPNNAQPPSWPQVAPLALWTYALAPAADKTAAAAIVDAAVAAAGAIADRAARHPYRISMTPRDYVWGSNGVVANYGLLLLAADRLRPDPRFRRAAADNLHYLLGRNTHSLSFVTRVGENAFRHPHHRPSGAGVVDAPWPGLLSGGPNRSKQDPAMRARLADLPPAKMYLDDQESYASNEIAINWNAPLVFLLAGMLPE